MKFLLIVEGHTEQSVVPDFLRRWLHSRDSLPTGYQLFSKLKPEVAYGKCPYLRKMLDEMECLALNALSAASG